MLAGGVFLAALRVKPQVWGDEGVWLSMAARLLDGDRLYVDVFDNKDPFFFYSYAAALWAAGVRGPFALEVVWLAVATFGLALALRSLGAGVGAMLAGALVYPFALTAAWYTPGATMVPALALAPVALWLWARGSTFAAGGVVIVSALFKLNLGLVVAAPLIALLVLGSDEQSRRRRALHAACGALVTLAAASLVLAVRGELRPYLALIDYNFHYSDAAVHGGGCVRTWTWSGSSSPPRASGSSQRRNSPPCCCSSSPSSDGYGSAGPSRGSPRSPLQHSAPPWSLSH